MEAVIKFLQRRITRLSIIAIVFISSLFLTNLFLFNRAAEILQEEEYLVDGRTISVNTVIIDSITPVEMINSHTRAVIESAALGLTELPVTPDFEYFPNYGIFGLYPESDEWSVLGIGETDGSGTSAGIELAAVLVMKDLYTSLLENRRDTAWIYYVSKHGFVFSAPSFPLVLSENLKRLYERDYWIGSLPENNPHGNMVITDAYEDMGGHGWTITLARPVYAQGEFMGVTCMDVSLDRLQAAIKPGRSIGVTSLIDENRRIVASQDRSITGTDYRTSLYGSVPSFGSFFRSGDRYLLERGVLDGELTLAHSVPRAEVRLQALGRSFPLIASLVILNVLVIFFLRLRHSFGIAASERDFSRRLISIIAHDLQSPLSVSRQATELLSDSTDNETIDLIRRSNDSMLSLLKDLTYWGRSRYGEVQLNPAPCDIRMMFERVTGIVRPSADLKEISLETVVDAPICFADADALSTIIRNLLSNAVKFSPPGKPVRVISSQGRDGLVDISVVDEGHGMNDRQIRRVLNRKSLRSKPGTRGEKGSGIGLSLVTSLCDQAGWPVAVTSTPENGTTFSISVPTE